MKIFLTGCTGLLGGELLVELSKRKEVKKIFCLVRAKNNTEAHARIKKVFALHNDYLDPEKILPVCGDLLDSGLENSLSGNAEIAMTNVVLHAAANTSFSSIYNDMIEQVNVLGLEKIIAWSKKLPSLEAFLYIGAATICGKNNSHRTIFEHESPSDSTKHFVKYTETKMKGELLLAKTFPENRCFIARPSIIMGDSRTVVPRSPVILWALATFNALRLCPVNEKAKLDIIPVDYAAKAIIRLLFSKRNHRVYHISSGFNSATNLEKLLQAIQPFFTEGPSYRFENKMLVPKIKKWARGSSPKESGIEGFGLYLDYWKTIFINKQNLRVIFAGLEPYIEFIELGQTFDNTRLKEDTKIHDSIPGHFYVQNFAEYLKNIDILSGAADS